MHMTYDGSPSPEPADTPAARCCGCCWPTPRSRSARSPAGSNAGEPLGALQPHLVPLADRVLEETTAEVLAGHDVVFLGLPHGQSAAIAGAARRRRRRDRLRRRLPARPTRPPGSGSTAARTPGPGPTGCPSCPASARARGRHAGSRCPAATRPSPPSPSPRRSPPASSSPTGRGRRLRAPRGAGKAPKPHLLGTEVMGSASAYGVGGIHRHTPEITQNLAALTDGDVRRVLHAAAGPDAPRHPRHLLRAAARRRRPRTTSTRPTRRRTPTSRSCTCCPQGQWPQTKSVLGSNAVHVQVTVDEAAGRLVAVGAVDNLAKGTAGAAVQCMNLALGLDGDHRAQHRGARAVKLSRYPETLAVVRLGPGAEVPAVGRVLLALLRHRDRHRDLDRLRGSQRADQVRAPAAVHRLRGRGPPRLRAHRRPGGAARAARRGGDQRVHALDVRHRLDPRPGQQRRPGRRGMAKCRARGPAAVPADPTEEARDERHPARGLPGIRRRRRAQVHRW